AESATSSKSGGDARRQTKPVSVVTPYSTGTLWDRRASDSALTAFVIRLRLNFVLLSPHTAAQTASTLALRPVRTIGHRYLASSHCWGVSLALTVPHQNSAFSGAGP